MRAALRRAPLRRTVLFSSAQQFQDGKRRAWQESGMRNRIYFVGFAIVAICTLTYALATLLSFGGVQVPTGSLWYDMAELLAHPIPLTVRYFLPDAINYLMLFVLAALVLRRLLRCAHARSLNAPANLGRVPSALVALSLALLLLGSALLALTLLREELGVAAMLLLAVPVVLLPATIMWAEVVSIRAERPQVQRVYPPRAHRPAK